MLIMTENVLVALIAHVPVTIAAVSALIVAVRNRKMIRTIYMVTNGNLDILLQAAREEGAVAERKRLSMPG